MFLISEHQSDEVNLITEKKKMVKKKPLSRVFSFKQI